MAPSGLSAASPAGGRPEAETPAPPGIFVPPPWAIWGLILVATCLAYASAMTGGVLWDDDAHMTKPGLRSWDGLYRIWFDVVRTAPPVVEGGPPRWAPGATQQYYPLLHSFFWLQWQLFGDHTLPYH